MANKNEAPPPAPAGDAPPPKGKRGKLIILAAALVSVVLVAGAAFFMLTKNHDADDPETASADEKPKKKKGEKEGHRPAYLSLEPFTVNLVSDSGEHYLQLMVTLDMQDEGLVERAKTYTPKLRNDITMLLSGKKAAEISSKEGKEALALEMKSTVNTILDPGLKGKKDAVGPVKEILFTSFIIQ